MKSILYLFRRFKVASTLNVLGVALALAGCYLLLTQIHFIRSYNHGIKDYENIYRLEIRGFQGEPTWWDVLPRPTIECLSKLPQLVNLGFCPATCDPLTLDKKGSIISTSISDMSDSLLIVLGAERVDGRIYTHPKEEGVIIPASLAELYFDDVMVAGKQMKISSGKRLNVIGVYKDFPENSIVRNIVYKSIGDTNSDSGKNWNYVTYLHFRSDIDSASANSIVRNAIFGIAFERLNSNGMSKAEAEALLKSLNSDAKALPLSETYMSGHDSNTDHGSKTTLFILELAVLLLVLISVINFTNYSTAQAPMRLRGVNTRKVMGESTLSLRARLMIEGVLVGIIAFAIAMLVDYSISLWGSVGQYVLGSVALTDHWCIALIVLGIGVLIGIFSTVYSAYYVTSFQPAMVLKGGFGLSPRGKSVRQLLIGFQFVIAFVMVILVGVIYSQSFYIRNSDYGYDKDALIIGDAYNIPPRQIYTLAQELERIKGVESVSYSAFALGLYDFTMKWTRPISGDSVATYFVIPVDWKFLRTCGIKIKEGRDFMASDSDVYVINDAMRNKYRGLKKIEDETIVGVCDKVRVFSTRIDNDSVPAAFFVPGKTDENWWVSFSNKIYVRVAPNTDKVQIRKQMESVTRKYTIGNVSPDFRYQDECLENAYHEEVRFMMQIRISTIIIFVITIIGVFCLTMFETEYRRKEIAIRKVMGSSVGEVMALFTRRYTLPLVISFIIAAPVAYYLGEQWLKNFAEHTPIFWWIFPLAFVLVSLVVLLTVVVQCWRVATMNPVDSIKTE